MLPVLTGIAGAIIAAFVTIYLDKRAKSGRVEHSEAKDLWETLRSELSRLQIEATALRAEISVGYTEMAALRNEATNVRNRFAALEKELIECRSQHQRRRVVK